MRLRALLGAALAAVLLLAVLPSAAEQEIAVVYADAQPSSEAGTAQSAAGCASGTVTLDSVGGHFYKYCGQYWPIAKLPLLVHINTFGAKPNAGEFVGAVQLAVQSWDAVAPISGKGPRPPGCANARIVCVSTISTGPGAAAEIDVGWGSFGPAGYIGVATVFGSSPGPIADVGITLNWDLPWYGSGDAARIGTGVPAGTAAGVGCAPAPALCPWTFDLVGIIAHELGHAFGLEDLNPGDGCGEQRCGWPNDLEDAPDYQQVMYAFYYPGSSNKRVPREGDIAGLARVMQDSQSH